MAAAEEAATAAKAAQARAEAELEAAVAKVREEARQEAPDAKQADGPEKTPNPPQRQASTTTPLGGSGVGGSGGVWAAFTKAASTLQSKLDFAEAPAPLTSAPSSLPVGGDNEPAPPRTVDSAPPSPAASHAQSPEYRQAEKAALKAALNEFERVLGRKLRKSDLASNPDIAAKYKRFTELKGSASAA